jgi:hypothetical protein
MKEAIRSFALWKNILLRYNIIFVLIKIYYFTLGYLWSRISLNDIWLVANGIEELLIGPCRFIRCNAEECGKKF